MERKGIDIQTSPDYLQKSKEPFRLAYIFTHDVAKRRNKLLYMPVVTEVT